jgi:hypothetical protein
MELCWDRLRMLLPPDLEDIAFETNALKRRRGVKSAEDLLRVLLMCALPKATMASVSAVCGQMGLARMNPSAVFFRLRDSEAFLEALLCRLLSVSSGGFGVRIVDATVLCGPNAKGPDQRVHVCYSPELQLPIAVQITDRFGGEDLNRHPLGPQCLVLMDRGYGYESQIRHALSQGASFLVRVEPCSNRFRDARQEPFAWKAAQSELCADSPREWEVFLPGGSQALRLVSTLNPEGKAVWLLTNLPQERLALQEVRELYRVRWQIELFFKRMKSLLDLDELATRDGPTARPWILAKFILAVLLVRLEREVFSPRQAFLERMAALSKWSLDDLALVA